MWCPPKSTLNKACAAARHATKDALGLGFFFGGLEASDWIARKNWNPQVYYV